MAFGDSVTGTGTWPSGGTIEAPANGDPYNNANAKAMFQKYANGLVANRTAMLKENITPVPFYNWGTLWTQNVAVPPSEQAESWTQTTVSGNELMKFWVPCKPGLTLATIVVWLIGVGGHTWPIQFPPSVYLQRKAWNNMSASWSAVSSAADPSGSAAAYQVYHSLTVSPGHVMDGAYAYQVAVYGEYGTNSIAGLIYYGGQITYT